MCLKICLGFSPNLSIGIPSEISLNVFHNWFQNANENLLGIKKNFTAVFRRTPTEVFLSNLPWFSLSRNYSRKSYKNSSNLSINFTRNYTRDLFIDSPRNFSRTLSRHSSENFSRNSPWKFLKEFLLEFPMRNYTKIFSKKKKLSACMSGISFSSGNCARKFSRNFPMILFRNLFRNYCRNFSSKLLLEFCYNSL